MLVPLPDCTLYIQGEARAIPVHRLRQYLQPRHFGSPRSLGCVVSPELRELRCCVGSKKSLQTFAYQGGAVHTRQPASTYRRDRVRHLRGYQCVRNAPLPSLNQQPIAAKHCWRPLRLAQPAARPSRCRRPRPPPLQRVGSHSLARRPRGGPPGPLPMAEKQPHPGPSPAPRQLTLLGSALGPGMVAAAQAAAAAQARRLQRVALVLRSAGGRLSARR